MKKSEEIWKALFELLEIFREIDKNENEDLNW